jgi:hypothetical protein
LLALSGDERQVFEQAGFIQPCVIARCKKAFAMKKPDSIYVRLLSSSSLQRKTA